MEFLNFMWPSTVTQGVPLVFAMADSDQMILAPTPDAAYRVNCVGVYRPQPLYTATSGTGLSSLAQDIFVAASCVWGFGALNQNFGAMADDPASAQSWENQYQLLKVGLMEETLRQKAWMESWQAFSSAPAAKQSRT